LAAVLKTELKRFCNKWLRGDTSSTTEEGKKMQLSVEDQWMLAYVSSKIHNWGDVRDDAARTMKKIKNHDDFISWSEYFLPNSRKDEIKRALIAYKIGQAKKKQAQSKPVQLRQVPVTMDEKVAKLLVNQARAEQCSISELLLKRLA
jgi:hypothetical protein